MHEEILSNLNLSKEETEIYLCLLEKGKLNAQGISKNTSVKRTYVYKVCENLLKKGLLEIKKEGKSTVFSPKSPDNLLSLAHEMKDRAEQNEKALEGILNSLQQKYVSVEERPIVKTYEGYEGLKKIYHDTIAEGKTIYAFLQNTDINPDFRQWLRETYLKQRVENKIEAKVIIASGEKSQMYLREDKERLRESVVIPSKSFPFEVEVNIYGSKVSFMNYKNKENPLGLIIDNAPIANSLKAFFDLNWNALTSSKDVGDQ